MKEKNNVSSMMHRVSKMWGGILQLQARSQRYRRAVWQGQKTKHWMNIARSNSEHNTICINFKCILLKNTLLGGFPGSSVVKNLPAKAEDMGSIPGLERSHMLRGNQAHVPQLENGPCSNKDPAVLQVSK